jgi:uncharacterized protein DUF1592/uncharacterized protein DUF1588/uncharacterized protein DUF1587/uncharacterized protein DUF1595/uncharacterized protein DUF1585
MRRSLPVRLTISLLLLGSGAIQLLNATSHIDAQTANHTDLGATDLAQIFNQTIRPFVTSYCTGCHSGPEPAASLDLQRYATMESVVDDFAHWALVQRKLTAKEMPPPSMKQPPEELRRQVIEWITALRKYESRKTAGDPGPVLARRLSNAEYNYTVRDLIGVDLRPAREFPIDPANQAGFDNSGESLTISPALMSKYLDAARRIANQLVLQSDGFSFAPFSMLVETDREKYTIQRIVDFYDRQPTDFADYFQAAWRYKHRAALGQPAATLRGIAAQMKLAPQYLVMIWRALEQSKEEIGPLARVQAMWRRLPAAKGDQPGSAREGCEQMRDFVVKIRRHTEMLYPVLESPGFSTNFQPITMFRNRELATHRLDFDRSALRVEGEPQPGIFVPTRGPTFGRGEAEELKLAVAAYIKERQEDPDLVVPAGERVRYEAAFARFSSIFPTAFCLRERGRFYPINTMDKGRLLGAGLHNVMGYFRDDTPLIELILDEKGKKEIDKLWHEFDFIADYTVRTYSQFVFNGGDGGRSIPVDRPGPNDFSTQNSIFWMRDQYLNKSAPGTNPRVLEAIKYYFDRTNDQIRWVEKARQEAEPRHLDALLKFAARAYRRPLVQAERDEILAYYRQLRETSGLTHEEAMRGSVASLLVSPDFLYRIDLADNDNDGHEDLGSSAQAAKRIATSDYRPLSAYSLASRLSYFLWSSMPDEELLSHAAAGDLKRPAVLKAQVRRMLKDDRALGLATEFAGAWLDFRRFEDHNAVDRERFPSFTNQLREAMFEEPIRFIADVIQHDRSSLDLLYGEYTFVNRVLAEHYGMPVPAGAAEWFRVDTARDYARGGLLPMAVFLTLNAPGLRTSPVKRGYWVARRVLGEVIPPPPPVVPELPGDESKSDLPVRDLLAKHRQNAACASCHARFDSFGLAFEGYGPIGERRTKDLAGRAVDVRASFPGGDQGAGLDGLISYIRAHREKDFLNNLSEKMLVYALGRSSLLSDELLLDTMQSRLAASGYKMSALIETIITSPQFLNRRTSELSRQSNSQRTSQSSQLKENERK